LMILLVWLYATGLALLIGAVINAEIERSSRNDKALKSRRGRITGNTEPSS
jgi:uncharacterized BrkB/YihY/UPF0761 family membrane protein